jgi:uncharacterized protein YegJ (DUF2314 family)
MRPTTNFFVLLSMLWASAHSTSAQAQRCSEFAEELAYLNVRESDDDIVEAKRRARSTFASARLSASKLDPSRTSLHVEIAIAQNGNARRVWVGDIREAPDGRFSGQIAYSDEKGSVQFDHDQVTDWHYTNQLGKLEGSYRACAVYRRLSKEAGECFRMKYRYTCRE